MWKNLSLYPKFCKEEKKNPTKLYQRFWENLNILWRKILIQFIGHIDFVTNSRKSMENWSVFILFHFFILEILIFSWVVKVLEKILAFFFKTRFGVFPLVIYHILIKALFFSLIVIVTWVFLLSAFSYTSSYTIKMY